MITPFYQHIQKAFPFFSGAKLLVAVSGGIDSVVLTHLLDKLGYSIALAHVNFQLRGTESDDDELWVIRLGVKLKIPVFVYKATTEFEAKKNKLSIQMAARNIRYRWFSELLSEQNYNCVLTAHHQDDSVETLFINLSRSTGLDGLTGIPSQSGKTLRPLLPFSKKAILKYAEEHNITWREDASNTSSKYLRNKIRHQLLPVLQKINPDYIESIVKTQSHLKVSQTLINAYINKLKTDLWEERNELIYISLKNLGTLKHKREILYELLKNYGFTAWEDVYQLTKGQSGKQVFSSTYRLLRDRDYLILSKIKPKNRKAKVPLEVKGAEFQIENLKLKITTLKRRTLTDFKSEKSTTVFIDKEKIHFPLFVRKWQKGDYFYPLGMKGKMKLSDYFINKKFSRVEKEKVWLLCDAIDTIVWLIGERLDNRYKITDKTMQLLKIALLK